MEKNFALQFLDSKLLNHKVKNFRFQIVNNYDFLFTPGKFVSLHLTTSEGKPIRRSYSVADFDADSKVLEFAVTLVENGVGTQSLCSLDEGEIIKATGPLGKFIFRENMSFRHVMIGTGTGIVPYRSMLKQIETYLQVAGNFCIVIEGVQNRNDMLYAENFLKLCAYPNFDFKVCFSRENSSLARESYEILGYVQNSFDSISLNPKTDMVYLCGNPYMIEDVTLILKNLGFLPEQIVKEQYYAKEKQNGK